MAYTPPEGDAIEFDFQGQGAYSPDAGTAVTLEWVIPAIEGVGVITYTPQISSEGFHHLNKGTGDITYSPAVVGSGYHHQIGTVEGALQFKLITPFEYLNKVVTGFLEFVVYEQSTLEAPLRFTVETNSGVIEAPLSIILKSIANIEAPIVIGVIGDQANWEAEVLVNGVDYSPRLTKVLEVEGEEGSARVATFTIVPVDGVINPFAFSGASVVINYLSTDSGESISQRMFTGLVDSVQYDPITRLLHFECTDNLQNRIAAMSRGSLDYLTGGRFSAAISGEDIVDNWEYTQECMRVVPGSIDAGVYGDLRVTQWNLGSVTKEYTVANILDETVGVDLARRSDIMNQVNIGYEFRFNRLRERFESISWKINPYYWLEQTIPLLAVDTVRNALEGTSWNMDSFNYVPFPEYMYIDQYGNPHVPSGNSLDVFMIHRVLDPQNTCMEFNARMRLRFSQTVTETYNLVVKSSQSIAKNGVLSTENTASTESEWDASDWENDYAADPQMPSGFSSTEKRLDYHPDITDQYVEDTVKMLVDIAKTDVKKAHRNTKVKWNVLCDPSIDLTWKAKINTPPVLASGKVSQFVHTLDFDQGTAITELVISVSGHGSSGITPVETPTAKPAKPVVPSEQIGDTGYHGAFGSGNGTYIGARAESPTYSEDWEGWIVNVRASFAITNYGTTIPTEIRTYNPDGTVQYTQGTAEQNAEGYSGNWPNPAYVASKAFPEEGFRVILPGVEDESREAYVADADSEFDVVIPEDEFQLSA